MNTSLVRLGLALFVTAAAAGAAHAQTSFVDLKNPKPRQVQSAVFTLSSPQDLQVHAIGAEAAEDGGTFSWVSAMWKTSSAKRDEPREPWMGNAWILDLSTRKVAWELSAASTRRGRRSLRTFDGPVHLPAGTYEAFYSA